MPRMLFETEDGDLTVWPAPATAMSTTGLRIRALPPKGAVLDVREVRELHDRIADWLREVGR